MILATSGKIARLPIEKDHAVPALLV